MASTTYLSFINLFETATVTASSEAAGYPAANVRDAWRPNLPWRSTGATTATLVFDLGSAIPFDRLVLVGANFASVTIQQHTADAWGAPAYSAAFTIGRDRERRRYRRWIASGGNFTRRYTRILIPTQTPLYGLGFEVGYVWAGTFTTLPRSPRVGYELSQDDPMVRREAALGKWAVQYETGDSFARHRYTRHAEKDPLMPGQGDEYQAWLDVDRQIAEAGMRFCYCVDRWGAGAAWAMHQVNTSGWRDVGLIATEDDWDLEEVVAG